MQVTQKNRDPLGETLARVGPALAGLVAIVTGLGSAGLLSAAQTTAISTYADSITAAAAPTGPIALAAGAVIGLLNGGATLAGILRAKKGATDQTTPITSPRDVDGAPLVRRDGLPLGGNPYTADALPPATATIPPSGL